MKQDSMDIWVYAQYRDGEPEADVPGLVSEARRFVADYAGDGKVTAVAIGYRMGDAIQEPGIYGADRIVYIESESLTRYHGELYSWVFMNALRKYNPSCIMMAENTITADLAPRLSALMESPLVTRAMDIKINGKGKYEAVRPVANGYLFEKLIFDIQPCPVICFLPSVLSETAPLQKQKAEIIRISADITTDMQKTKITGIIESSPEDLNIEEADIIISAGRGAGRGDSFNIIHELAGLIGGSVGGTRPVIDWDILPFERQIGQTGKTVAPRLMFACGISGANEFTAGMERSQLVVAINKDPNARIFRFADLSVTGDLQEIIPLLIKKIKEKSIPD